MSPSQDAADWLQPVDAALFRRAVGILTHPRGYDPEDVNVAGAIRARLILLARANYKAAGHTPTWTES